MTVKDLNLDDFVLVERWQIQQDALNDAGTVFGGWTLAQSDYAASILAERRVRGSVVTATIKEFQFHHPGLLADIFDFYARLTFEGRTSLHIQLEVVALRYFRQPEEQLVHIASGSFVFVHVDDSGRPSPLP